jgi:hypothetical protein
MNRKQVKRINRLADVILMDWLRTIVPEEDQDNITEDNFESMLPEAPYFSVKKSRRVSFFTQRWAKQKIKKLYKSGVPLENIKDISWLQELNQA